MNSSMQPEPPRSTAGTAVVGSRRSRRWAVALSTAGMATAGALLWGGFAAVDTVQAGTAGSASPAVQTAAVLAGSQPLQVPDHAGAHAAPPAEAPAGPKVPGNGNVPPAGKDSGIGKPGEKLAPQASAEKAGPGSRKEKSLAEAGAEAAQGPAGAKSAEAGNAAVDRSRGLAQRGPIDPKAVTGGKKAAPGGCVVEYGADGQCLPVVPPSMAEHARQMANSGVDPLSMQHSWACEEVRSLFPEGVAVRQAAIDPQRLDTNGDGAACGPGD